MHLIQDVVLDGQIHGSRPAARDHGTRETGVTQGGAFGLNEGGRGSHERSPLLAVRDLNGVSLVGLKPPKREVPTDF